MRNLLHTGVIYSDTETVNILLKHGVDTDQEDICGRTPLDLIKKKDRNDIQKVILFGFNFVF